MFDTIVRFSLFTKLGKPDSISRKRQVMTRSKSCLHVTVKDGKLCQKLDDFHADDHVLFHSRTVAVTNDERRSGTHTIGTRHAPYRPPNDGVSLRPVQTFLLSQSPGHALEPSPLKFLSVTPGPGCTFQIAACIATLTGVTV